VRAIAFDLFGTLVDFTTLRDRVAPFGVDGDRFVEAWRQKQLAYAMAATIMKRYVDFEAVTGHALDYVAATFGLSLSREERGALAAAWSELPVYADVPEALGRLRAAGARLVVLSNGTPASIRQTVQRAGLLGEFDALLSVDTVRAFKPDFRVYELAVKYFELPPDRIAFVSSNGWDAAGASEYGFDVWWCNRRGLPTETFGKPPAHTIASLAQLAV
jgi:2-haloacid dehalogenase